MRITKKELDKQCEALNEMFDVKMNIRATCGYYNLELQGKQSIVVGLSSSQMYYYLCGMKATVWYFKNKIK